MFSENNSVPSQKKITQKMYSKSGETMTSYTTTECKISSLAGADE